MDGMKMLKDDSGFPFGLFWRNEELDPLFR